jgi:hypothetical protein
MLVSASLFAEEPGTNIIRFTYRPLRQGTGDVLAMSWRTDSKASLASVILSAQPGGGQVQKLQLRHDNLHPLAQISYESEHRAPGRYETGFYDEFTYGPGKSVFSTMGIIQVETIVWDQST